LFAHHSAIKGAAAQKNQKVSFDVVSGPKGAASNIEILRSGAPARPSDRTFSWLKARRTLSGPAAVLTVGFATFVVSSHRRQRSRSP
jgi:hypothetical protein